MSMLLISRRKTMSFIAKMKEVAANAAARSKHAAEVSAAKAKQLSETETGKTLLFGAQVGAGVGVALAVMDSTVRVYKAITY